MNTEVSSVGIAIFIASVRGGNNSRILPLFLADWPIVSWFVIPLCHKSSRLCSYKYHRKQRHRHDAKKAEHAHLNIDFSGTAEEAVFFPDIVGGYQGHMI